MATDSRRTNTDDLRRLINGQAVGQTCLRLAGGQIVCRQGDPPDAVFYIQGGQVKISIVSPNGKEAVTGVRGEGDFFGVRSLLGGDQRLATVTALTECIIIRIRKAAMTRLLRERPDLVEMFVSYLLRQHLRDQENLIDQLTNSAERRLARVLLQFRRHRRTGSGTDRSNGTCQHDRDHASACELIHEQVQAKRIHRIRSRGFYQRAQRITSSPA
jgi:CRP/FNR family cyclic AMP-dependent transcriptional regulator